MVPLKLDSERLRVLDAVNQWPGLTSKELAFKADLDRHSVARRLPELERDGQVEGEKSPGCDTQWWPAI